VPPNRKERRLGYDEKSILGKTRSFLTNVRGEGGGKGGASKTTKRPLKCLSKTQKNTQQAYKSTGKKRSFPRGGRNWKLKSFVSVAKKKGDLRSLGQGESVGALRKKAIDWRGNSKYKNTIP